MRVPCGVLPLALLLLAASAPPACVLATSAVVFQDTFSALNPGLSCDNTTSPWCFKYTDTATAGVKFRGRTMVIDPYNATVGLEAGALGVLDHVKGLVMTKQVFPTPSGKKLTWTLSVGAAMTNTSHHPFGHAVTKPNDDLRLAMCGLVSVDETNGLVTDFQMTNDGVYAYYERLPFWRNATNNYAAFSQAKRVASRHPQHINDLTIQYEPTAKTLSWFVGRKRVLFVDKIGYLSTDPHVVTLINVGGTEEVVSSFVPSIGFGCFTLLDAIDPWKRTSNLGLVRLAPRLNATTDNYVVPSRFVDEMSNRTSRLWGQGAVMTLKSFKVSLHA